MLTAALAGLMLVSIFARLPFSDNMPQLAAAYPGPGIASSLALFSVPLLWQYQRMTPVTSAIGGVAILVVAALSYNRMVWLALLCVLVLAELLEKRGRGSRKGVILALVGIVFLGMSISIIARFGSTDEIVKHSSSDPRLAGWQIWLSHAEQRPLYGWGTGKPLLVKTLSATEKMALERVDGDNLLGHGHNMVLNVLLQQGLVGLLLWGWLWGMLLAICWRARSGAGRSWANGGILLLAAALLKGMTDDFMDQSVLYAFWLMLGLMIGSAHQLAREHQE